MTEVISVIKYRDTDGFIARAGRTQKSHVSDYMAPGYSLLYAECDIFNDYVDVKTKTVKPRPEFPRFDKTALLTNGEDTATLEFGKPFKAVINGQEVQVTDGKLVLDASMPGQYKVTIKHWPYLDYEETISCGSL